MSPRPSLTLSSSERGVDHPESLDLAALADDVLLSFGATIDNRGLRVEADIRPASFSGDPVPIQRLVANLLDNSPARGGLVMESVFPQPVRRPSVGAEHDTAGQAVARL